MDEVLIAKLLIQGMKKVEVTNGVLYACGLTPKILRLPEGLLGLYTGCLSGQSVLERVTLPFTLKDVGECVFANCEHLRTVLVPVSLKEYESRILSGTEAEIVYVSSNKKD